MALVAFRARLGVNQGTPGVNSMWKQGGKARVGPSWYTLMQRHIPRLYCVVRGLEQRTGTLLAKHEMESANCFRGPPALQAQQGTGEQPRTRADPQPNACLRLVRPGTTKL